MRAREREAYRLYKASDNCSLRDVYGRFSEAKYKAWVGCRKLCRDKGGHNLRIITANGFQFTAGFEYEEDGKPMFMYITKASNTECEIEQEGEE